MQSINSVIKGSTIIQSINSVIKGSTVYCNLLIQLLRVLLYIAIY